MVLKSTSARKFASLSAFGVGALVVGAKPANATVVFSGVLNAKVGFDAGSGFGASYTSPALGVAGPSFKFTAATHTIGHIDQTFLVNFNHVGSLKFAANGTPLAPQVFSAGATWGAKAGSAGSGTVEDRATGVSAFAYGLGGTGPFTDKYFLINFGPGGALFGWIEATLQVDKSANRSGVHGPNLTVISYAFDDSGFALPAGQTSGPATPEPGTFGASGLAALALGAAGLRRWRGARQQSQSAATIS